MRSITLAAKIATIAYALTVSQIAHPMFEQAFKNIDNAL